MILDPTVENPRKWRWPRKLRRAICGEVKPPLPPEEIEDGLMDSA